MLGKSCLFLIGNVILFVFGFFIFCRGKCRLFIVIYRKENRNAGSNESENDNDHRQRTFTEDGCGVNGGVVVFIERMLPASSILQEITLNFWSLISISKCCLTLLSRLSFILSHPFISKGLYHIIAIKSRRSLVYHQFRRNCISSATCCGISSTRSVVSHQVAGVCTLMRYNTAC